MFLAVPNLYIIAGCNGAGKTTLAYTLLPDILKCSEYINADEIAKGISPFQASKVAFQSRRIMLERIKTLLTSGEDFAFETALAARSYINLIENAQEMGYRVTLLFLWLNSPELALERVKARVESGGQGVDKEVLKRRYAFGIRNLNLLYMNKCDSWMIFDNSNLPIHLIAEGHNNGDLRVYQVSEFNRIISL